MFLISLLTFNDLKQIKACLLKHNNKLIVINKNLKKLSILINNSLLLFNCFTVVKIEL